MQSVFGRMGPTTATATQKEPQLKRKRKTTSSTPDLSLVVNGASNPVFGDRKKLTELKMKDFKVLYDWLQARGISCELDLKLKS